MTLSRGCQLKAHPIFPLGIVIAQMVLVGCWLSATGRFSPEVVNDTASYNDLPLYSLEAALNHQRTPAYPLFLRANEHLATKFRSVPLTQYAVYVTAVFVFFVGVSKVTSSRTLACVSASTLLYSRVLHGHVNIVATDCMASAIGIAVCGLVLWRVAACKHFGVTTCLIGLTTVGWLIRPAYLFLTPLVPILTWLFHGVSSARGESRLRAVFLTLLMTAVPVLAYCSLRYCVMGRFGIVSFGGYNQIGIAGQFLQKDDLANLSQDLRPIAETVLEYRSSGSLPCGKYDDLPRMNYMRLEDRYDITIWHEFSPAARRFAGNDAAAVNTQLRRLGTELICLHPGDYVTWLMKAVRQAVKKVLWDFADNPFSLLMLSLALLRLCWPGFLTSQRRELEQVSPISRRVLLLTSVAYVVLNLTVVILVCPPLGRFTDAAAVLLNIPLAAWLCGCLKTAAEEEVQFASGARDSVHDLRRARLTEANTLAST